VQHSALIIDQYTGHFNELACFAPYMVADEENRVRKFDQGLNPYIHDCVVCFEIQNFVELVNKAFIAEKSLRKNVMAMVESQKRVAPLLNQNQGGWKCRLNEDNQRVKPIRNRPSSANGTPCPKCQCPHYGPCCVGTNICYRCGQVGHFVHDCPKQRGGAASLQTENNRKPPTQAKVYALTSSETEMENGVITCILPLFTGKVVILFDSSATHSFISAKYARRFHINLEPMEVRVVVFTLVGKSVICRKIVMGCPIYIEGRTLIANLIVFDIEGFDIILRIDWLSSNHAIIDCHNKEIIFRLPTDSEFKFVGTKVGATPQLISTRMSSLPGMLKRVTSGGAEDGGDTRGARIY
jgi:hypothetical protein